MAKVNFTAALRSEYQTLFDACQVSTARASEVDKLATRLLANQARYEGVGDDLDIPWQVIAVIHNMECSQNFTQHLHNGDPLTARTVHVPAGRPKDGTPPFTWEASAADALTVRKLPQWDDWSVPGILYCLEGYNGWGYRLYHPDVKSPYLWGASNHYASGKYVKDGTWSSTAVSAQCGAATLLRRLAEKGAVDAEPHVADTRLAASIAKKAPLLAYAPARVTPGGQELQRFLNGFPGIYLREDGKVGQKTSDACMQIFGHYLEGDPRA
jgi:lysozyme family protein